MARFTLFIVSVLALGGVLSLSPPGVVSPSLLQKIKGKMFINAAIILKSSVSNVYDQAATMQFANRVERITTIRQALIQYTEQSQAGIRHVLHNRGLSYHGFWITNRIIVKNPDLETILQLAEHPDVSEIREEIVIPVAPVVESFANEDRVLPVRGIFMVNGQMMWDQGINGTGIITSHIDTGVQFTHSILRDNFRREYGWYDPTFKTPEPTDENGHGTHTLGTIAGRGGFGMAPGSQWISCKGCQADSCAEFDLIGCGEWIACPTLTNGSNPDCSKIPHVVGNSWGSTMSGWTFYDDVITGWHAAGIIPVFSAGNAGSSCGTVGSPGDRPGVISVAATDMNDAIAKFSSRGPAGKTDEHKPEISAPGVDVLSSYIGDDEAFKTLDGTSMASPHVSGGIALMLQQNRSLVGDYEGVRTAMFGGARKNGLTGSTQQCGGIASDTFPNHVFGHGRLDVFAASESQDCQE